MSLPTMVQHIARFESHLRTTDSGCVEYDGYRKEKGYGVICVDGVQWYAHRFAYTLSHGSIPDGLFVCHRCDNPACVNLAHLFLGTHLDNMRDAVSKGRDRNSKKTHCKRGHEFTPENTYRRKGDRQCRACARAALVRFYSRTTKAPNPKKPCRACGKRTRRESFCSAICADGFHSTTEALGHLTTSNPADAWQSSRSDCR